VRECKNVQFRAEIGPMEFNIWIICWSKSWNIYYAIALWAASSLFHSNLGYQDQAEM